MELRGFARERPPCIGDSKRALVLGVYSSTIDFVFISLFVSLELETIGYVVFRYGYSGCSFIDKDFLNSSIFSLCRLDEEKLFSCIK